MPRNPIPSASQPEKVQAAGLTPISYRKILVGYDGSKNADRALLRAANIAREQSASLRVIVVANTISLASTPMGPPLPEVFDDIVKDAEQSLSHALESVSKVVPQVTGSVERGYVADAILNKAAEEDSDLIVLGRRGISGIERFLLGGVSSSIVNHSKCDVLIVR